MIRTIGRAATVAALLLLAACGGAEKYSVPAAEATSMLAGLGHSPAVSPMPAMLIKVRVDFESLSGGRSVHWKFSLNGNDLGKIVATVAPDGASASTVRIDYVEGMASISRRNSDIRAQLQGNVKLLLVESIDSTLEGRPFNMALREQIETRITSAMVGSAFQDVSDELDAQIAAGDWDSDVPANDSPSPEPRDAAQPTTDLRKYNN